MTNEATLLARICPRLNQFCSNRAQKAWSIAIETVHNWENDNVSRLAAALSCYTILSVAPLAILSVALASSVFGQTAARGQIATRIGAAVGPEAARAIESLILNARAPGSGLWGTGFGIIVLLIGASGVFVELQSAMNMIWKVESASGQVLKAFVRQRFFSFAMVLAAATLLLLSLVLSATLGILGSSFEGYLPGGARVWQLVNVVGSLALTTALFALVFKVVPDVAIAWKDLLPGAFLTATLFTIGKLLLGVYIQKSSIMSSFGAVGSLVALLVWVYVSSQIFFLGVEFTVLWVQRSGRSATTQPTR